MIKNMYAFTLLKSNIKQNPKFQLIMGKQLVQVYKTV